MHSHLVAVKVGVESSADQRVQLDSVTLDKHRLESLNAQAVQGGSTVQENVATANHFFKNSPDFGNGVLNQTTSPGDVIRELTFQKFGDDEWFEKL